MPMFEIIRGIDGTPKADWVRYMGPYTDPQEAVKLVKQQNERSGRFRFSHKYMLRKIPEQQNYIAREGARPDYKPFEVQGEEYHCAEIKELKVSFYSTLNDAYENRRTEMNLGRYLRRFTEMSDNDIADICAKHGVDCGDMSLKWARTREEIKNVYIMGPRSCMAGDIDEYGAHPTEAYASPDIALAYIVRDERITARAIVNTVNKKYVSIYGDKIRMEPLLEAEGYEYSAEALKDARLLKITIDNNRYAYPYLDGSYQYVYDDGKTDYMVIGNDCGATGYDQGWVWIDSAQDAHHCHDDNDDDDYDNDDW